MRKVKYPITKQQLLFLQESYHTDKKISKSLNISVSRVCQLRKFFGIPIFTIGKENHLRNRFIYTSFKENNISKKELSVKCGLSLMTITRIIKFFKEK